MRNVLLIELLPNGKQAFQAHGPGQQLKSQAIRPVLEKFITKGSVKKEDDDFGIETEMQRSNAKELNPFPSVCVKKSGKNKATC